MGVVEVKGGGGNIKVELVHMVGVQVKGKGRNA